jgi:alpha-glucosidase
MTEKFRFGNPFETESVTADVELSHGEVPFFVRDGNSFSMKMDDDTIVYGLGENVRGMNKRGGTYTSFCTDEFEHDENKKSLYAAHNFFIVDSLKNSFGVFVDSPGKVFFDVGFEKRDLLTVKIESGNFNLYIIQNLTLDSIVTEFRNLIGRSYIPPRWAFGVGQSRWGYSCREDIQEVADGYRKKNIPLDMIFLDIDYMDSYRDFTVDEKKFPQFEDFAKKLRSEKIRLVPIIDAAIKAESGFSLYEEGREKNFFCKDENGKDFLAGVWPGKCVLPDFLNSGARKWFGEKYRKFLDMGIGGFWNDMNEPALFYSEKNLKKVFDEIASMKNSDIGLSENFALKDAVKNLANSETDYKSFFHDADGKKIRHYDVHNLYGYNMTRAAGEAFDEFSDRRILMVSRASCIGSHRYGGIWMGDNKSQWAHLLMNLKMLPSLNMCGFLFAGADTGGFAADTSEDLLLRWYALSIFMPFFRNHSALGTRRQEPYLFDSAEIFSEIISLRYRLLPYIYSEFMKSALKGTMFARPLGFVWKNDDDARHCEDQILIGESMMIAPVYEQNAKGRHVYLPEEMKMIVFRKGEIQDEKILEKGHAFIHVALDEVAVFLRKGFVLPLAEKAESVDEIDFENLSLLSFAQGGAQYELYTDDGETKEFDLKKNTRILTC